MKICSHCGYEHPDSIEVCSHCGYALAAAKNEKAGEPSTAMKEKLAGFEYEYLGNGHYAIISAITTAIDHYQVPEGVTEIRDYAFARCWLMQKIKLPSTLEKIGSYAFDRCTKLTDITIPSSVTFIGKGAFHLCFALKKVILPDGLTVLSEGLFHGASSLKKITLPSALKRIEPYAFYETGIKQVEVPTSVEHLADQAFTGTKRVCYLGTKEQWKKIDKQGKQYASASERDFVISFPPPTDENGKPRPTPKQQKELELQKLYLDRKIKATNVLIKEQKEEVRKAEARLGRCIISSHINIFLIALAIISAFLFFFTPDNVNSYVFLFTGAVPYALYYIMIIISDSPPIYKRSRHAEETHVETLRAIAETLSEMRRVFLLELEEITSGKTVPKEDKKYRLSFYNRRPRICQYCGHVTEVLLKTTYKTDDVVTKVKTKHDHYSCEKHGKSHVNADNTCNDFIDGLTVVALNKAQALLDDYLKEEDERTAYGFR